MKNWELKQFLNTVRSDYCNFNDKISMFSRTDACGKEYHIFRSHREIIDEAITYIEELEAKVEELSYAQNIINIVKQMEEQKNEIQNEASSNRGATIY